MRERGTGAARRHCQLPSVALTPKQPGPRPTPHMLCREAFKTRRALTWLALHAHRALCGVGRSSRHGGTQPFGHRAAAQGGGPVLVRVGHEVAPKAAEIREAHGRRLQDVGRYGQRVGRVLKGRPPSTSRGGSPETDGEGALASHLSAVSCQFKLTLRW